MRIAVALWIVAALAACGKDKDKGGGGGGGGDKMSGKPEKMEGGGGMVKSDKKPIPPDKLTGNIRLVNLYVAPDGKTQKVDIWATGGWPAPTKLASGIEFGKASEWIKTPIGVGMRLTIVSEGADGTDAAKKVAELSVGTSKSHETHNLERSEGKASASWTSVMDDQPKPPAGKGIVWLHASQLQEFEKELTASAPGGRSFVVGAPGGKCNNEGAMLGGTNATQHEVAPGKATFTFHKFPGDCKSPAVYTLDVDVAADAGVRVEVYTKDGKSLAHTTMPLKFKE